MLPETWTLLSRSAADCMVSRNQAGRVTVWQLRLTDKGWRVLEILFSRPNAGCNRTLERHKTYDGQCQEFKGGCWDRQQHPNGIRLTVNRVDTILREYCEGSRG